MICATTSTASESSPATPRARRPGEPAGRRSSSGSREAVGVDGVAGAAGAAAPGGAGRSPFVVELVVADVVERLDDRRAVEALLNDLAAAELVRFEQFLNAVDRRPRWEE